MATLPQGRALTLSKFDGRLNEASRCDLSELTFVDAYGLVGTACALLAAGNRGETPPVLLPQGPTAGHLTRMGFIRFLGEIGLADGVEPPHHPHVVVPLEVVHDVNAAEKISHLLWASVREHVDPSVLQALNEGLWEMVANALEEVTALDGDLLIRSGSGTLREGAEGRRTHEVPHIDGTVAAMSLPLYPGT